MAKNKADQQIEGLLFQAEAAKRYMDNMINNHQCDSGSYYYATNSAATCGLTMEQMVATCYWASKDTSHFKKNAPKNIDTLFPIIRQLYDMRRGYDIDRGVDKPEDNIFPVDPGRDNNRCHGGGVNSLASALSSIHTLYNVQTVTAEAIEEDIKRIYAEIVSKNLENIKKVKDQEVLKKWSNSGRVTGELREVLEAQFKEDYLANFEGLYKGYIADSTLQSIINRGLDNVVMPKDLKLEWSQNEMAWDDVYAAIANETLPLLHLDINKGYLSTLNYLIGFVNNEGLIKNLLDTALKAVTSDPASQRVLLYLSQSGLSKQYGETLVHTIGDVSLKLEDISSLSQKELDALLKAGSLEKALEVSLEQKGFNNLFMLYAHKVGFKEKDLERKYGSQQYNLLNQAIEQNNVDAVRFILDKYPQKAKQDLNTKDSKGMTPLIRVATGDNRIKIIEAILEKYPEQASTLSIPYGKKGKTALDNSLYSGLNISNLLFEKHPQQVEEMLGLLIKHRNKGTHLHSYVIRGQVGIIKILLEKYPKKIKSILNIKDEYGRTAYSPTVWLHISKYLG